MAIFEAMELPTRCPLCAGPVQVARVHCEACGTGIDNRFELGWPGRLTKEQLAFAQVFLLCRGKIKDVEQALGISYPTVVSRLDALVGALGVAPSQPAPSRMDVLDELARGDIDVDEAERRLKKR